MSAENYEHTIRTFTKTQRRGSRKISMENLDFDSINIPVLAEANLCEIFPSKTGFFSFVRLTAKRSTF